ncbi:FHA domain-containing protein [Desulfobacterales bacterium HSG17]|nr:FHA domain-containing protein [Desulfobacterales bacterium HSG17]
MNRIIQMENETIVKQIDLKKDRYKLGRDIENDIVFDTLRVSRNHAEIIKKEQEYYIIDKGSANHVFVNGTRVEKCRLKSGDKINLSQDITLFYLGQNIEEKDCPDINTTNIIEKKQFFSVKEVIKQIISLDHLDNILKIILKEVIALVGADRGFIALTDENGNLIPDNSISHNLPLNMENFHESVFSHSTVFHAIQTKKKIFIKIGENNDQDLSKSILSLELQSIMCAPLLFEDNLKGVLYVDSGYMISDFNEIDQFFFSILADLAAIAIENSRQYSRMEMSVHELEQEIDNSEERYRSTLEALPDPIIIIRLSDSCLVQINTAFCNVFDYLEEDIIGRTISEFKLFAFQKDINHIIDIVSKNHEIKGFETRMLTNTGKIFDVIISAGFINILDEDCMVVIATGITDHKKHKIKENKK